MYYINAGYVGYTNMIKQNNLHVKCSLEVYQVYKVFMGCLITIFKRNKETKF